MKLDKKIESQAKKKFFLNYKARLDSSFIL